MTNIDFEFIGSKVKVTVTLNAKKACPSDNYTLPAPVALKLDMEAGGDQ